MIKYKMVLKEVEDFAKREVLSRAEKRIIKDKIKNSFMRAGENHYAQRVALLLQGYLISDAVFLTSFSKDKDYSRSIIMSFKRNDIKIVIYISLMDENTPIKVDRFLGQDKKDVHLITEDKNAKSLIYNLLIGK